MARLPEMFSRVSKLHTMRFFKTGKEREPMSDSNSETPDDRTEQEKAQDEALMFLRMAIRQINSGDYIVARGAYGTTPIPAGTNKAGLPRYVTGVASIAIGLEHDDGQQPDQSEDVPTDFTKTTQPAEVN